MASQSLYRKWRSQTFSDLIGQEATTRTLLNAVRDGRLAHAYLFCGPRGTGKTSAARLLAKAINCANPANGEPCNECLSCREITAGQSPDVIEIDAASNTGVEDIRTLRQNVNLLGTGGRFKVYIIDEVHQLSAHAFNALLKTLEEPPPHVIFVLATTEAHKVLATIVSRCQRFDFRRISMRDIVARLRHVAEGEGLELEPAAADLLARAAQGGMRDALSLLDQALAYCGTQIDLERTRTMLGLADPGALRQLLVAVAEQRPADALHQLNELVVTGADLRQLQQQLGEEWRALLLARAGADVAEVMDRTSDEARELTALAGRFSLDELMACARVFARSETPARGLPVPQLALELALLECLTIRRNDGAIVAQVPAPAHTYDVQLGAPGLPHANVVPMPTPPERAPARRADDAPQRDDSAQRIEERPEATPRDSAPTDSAPTDSAPAGEWPAAHASETVEGETVEGETVEGETPLANSAPREADGEPREPAMRRPDVRESLARAETTPSPAAPPSAPAGTNWLAQTQREWGVIQKVCKQRSQKIAALLHHARPVGMQPGTPPTIVVQVLHDFHFRNLKAPEHKQMVEWAMEQVLGTPVRLTLTMEEAGEPPSKAGEPPSKAGGGKRAPATSNGTSNGNGAHAAHRPAPSAQPDPHASNGTENGTEPGVKPAKSAQEAPSGNGRGHAANGHAANGHGASVASPSTNEAAPADATGAGHRNDHQPADQSLAASLEQQVQGDEVIQEVERELAAQLLEVRAADEDDEPF
ncbi:MAG TPA: DNA polymerase III subunit gamma/tau [Ktedonobacterales bacterium]